MNIDEILKLIDYNKNTGVVTWSEYAISPKITPGKEVGSVKKGRGCPDYRQTRICGKWFSVHRLIWLKVYGVEPDQIDHINGDGLDNRLCNLRNVDQTGNQRNRPVFKKSRTGVSGVKHSENGKKYLAYICDKNKPIHLGTFDTIFEAACARRSAENRLGYFQNRH